MVAIDESLNETKPKNTDSLVLPVDAEHTGIRAVGCTTMVLGAIGLFFLLAQITSLAAFIVILVSLITASGVSYLIERYLKQNWPSGRILEVTDEVIALRKKGETQRQIDPQQYVNVLAWNFTVKRSSRVKKGWHVLGMSLEQDGEFIPVYTFASPEDFENLPLADNFTTLVKQTRDKDGEKVKPTGGSMRRAGEQRRLHEAEYDRGVNGAEVTLEQFNEYLEHLQENYPDWMIS